MQQIHTTSYVRPLVQNTYSYRKLYEAGESKRPSRFKCLLASATALVESIAYAILTLLSKIFHPHEENPLHYWRFAKGSGAVFLVGLQGVIHPERTAQIYQGVIEGLDNEYEELIKQQHRHMQTINKKLRQQHVDAKSFNQKFYNDSRLNQSLMEKVSTILKGLENEYSKVSNLEKYNTLENAYAAIHSAFHEF